MLSIFSWKNPPFQTVVILMILMASLAIVILSWMSVNVLIRVSILKKYL